METNNEYIDENIIKGLTKFLKRKKVKSTNLKDVIYYSKERILEVKFMSGIIYIYYDVPKSEYENLLKAKDAGSIGKYFYKNIRFKYDYEQTES